MPDSAALTEVADALRASVEAAASELEHLVAPKESDLKQHMRMCLDKRLSGAVLESIERTVGLAGWPKVGPVDLAIALPASPPIFVELKWGDGTLYNCAWDALKLALALSEGAAGAAYLIAGAQTREWEQAAPGSEFFARRRWKMRAVLNQHAPNFEYWRKQVKARPRRLPEHFSTEPLADAALTVAGFEWRIVAARVIARRAPATVEIAADGVVAPTASRA